MWLVLLSLFSLVLSEPLWDEQGYILYCPCMGRFGNQAAHFLGALAFAKRLNRTLTLPPWRTYVRQRNVPFKDWFKPEVVLVYHKSLPLEVFLKLFGKKWPVGERTGYCYRSHKPDVTDCEMKVGNPFGPFWNELGIDFDRSEFTFLSYDTESQHLMDQWIKRYPPNTHPVLAFKGAPASFPVKKTHRPLQAYLVWSDTISSIVEDYILKTMNGARYIGIHLRIGSDWSIACEHAIGTRSFMESLQCLEDEQNSVITKEICFPSTKHVIADVQSVIAMTGMKVVYIASDKEPPLAKLKEGLGSEVKVYYMNPELPQADLAMLGRSQYFIGNCVSSFSAFVKRERDLTNLPTSFWGHIKLARDEL